MSNRIRSRFGVCLASIVVLTVLGLVLFPGVSVKAESIDSDLRVKIDSVLGLAVSSCNLSDPANVVNVGTIWPSSGPIQMTQCEDIKVTTNIYEYWVNVSSTKTTMDHNPVLSPQATIPSTTGTIAAPIVLANGVSSWGFAFPNDNLNLTAAFKNFGANTAAYTSSPSTQKYAAIPIAGLPNTTNNTTSTFVYKNDLPTGEDNYKIFYSVKSKPDQKSGLYQNTVTFTAVGDTTQNDYWYELKAIENLAKKIYETNGTKIGTALTQGTAVMIRGINYWENWYLVTSANLKAVNPSLDTTHANYIVRYNEYGYVMSIPGEIIAGSPVHTYNYFGEVNKASLETNGLLTAVTNDSTKSATQWGELTVGSGASTIGGGGTYDGDGGLMLGTQHAVVPIDQTKPVDMQYSVMMTVKGAYPQTEVGGSDTYPRTIEAISAASGAYLTWVGFRSGFLQIYSFCQCSAKNVTTDTTTSDGFTSIKLDNYVPAVNLNNQFINIQITALRGGNTKVYINGVLIRTFASGASTLAYQQITIGDLRPGRGLRYIGGIYNFALYSEVLSDTSIQKNWEFVQDELGI